jgi:uncharacterized membrane protein YfcA
VAMRVRPDACKAADVKVRFRELTDRIRTVGIFYGIRMSLETTIGLVFFGVAVGTVGTLIGAGGGFLIIPVFLFIYPDKSPAVLTAVSLAVICANATSGSIAYAKMKRINYRAGILFALAAIPGSIAGAIIVEYISLAAFDVVFGITLIAVGVYLFISGKQFASHPSHADVIPHYNLLLGMVISVFVGLLSSLLGIGGGIIHVPMMVYILRFPVHLATATSHFVLAIMTLAGTIVHICQGNLTGQWYTVLMLTAGVIVGAQIGAAISQKFKSSWIIRILAVALMIVGVRILL